MIGFNILQGSLDNYGSLVAAIKLVDVVICAIGAAQVEDQFNFINAIKEVGCIKVQQFALQQQCNIGFLCLIVIDYIV